MIYVCVFLSVIGFYFIVHIKKISLKISEILFKRIIVFICIASLLAFGMELSQMMDNGSVKTSRIQRESYGGLTKWETYIVQIGKEQEESIDIEVSPRIYDGERLELLFQKAMTELDKVIIGENASLEHINRNITLPTRLEGYPFTINWELSRYDVMDLNGNLIQKELVNQDPENTGIPITITGYLNYEKEKEVYQTELLLYAGGESEDVRNSIQGIVKKANENSKEEEYLELPSEWKGQELIWKRQESNTGFYLMFFSILISVLLVMEERQKEEMLKKERREEMLRDYPEIISQFTLLLSAGMTAKNVWRKMAEDYKWHKRISGKQRMAYEEILYTWQEMQSGIPEAECYERFGRRCELLPYVKMAALLAQNLRKGARGIAEMLRMEAVEALDERKNRAKRLGEEAGTKLLIPMILMLIVVLAIVIVPAFWSAIV